MVYNMNRNIFFIPQNKHNSFEIEEALDLPDTVLGSNVDEPTILLNTGKPAKQGVGTHF